MHFNKGFQKVAIAPLLVAGGAALARGLGGALVRKVARNPGAALNTGLNVMGAASDYGNMKSQLASKVRT